MNTKKKKSRHNPGFTLVELMVVIAIIGFLAAVIVPRFFQQIGRGQRAAAQVQIKNIEGALGMYFSEHYKYPDSLSELVPRYLARVPVDPWGNPYHYSPVSQHGQDFDLASWGADGAPGGTGDDADITNWDMSGAGGQ